MLFCQLGLTPNLEAGVNQLWQEQQNEVSDANMSMVDLTQLQHIPSIP